MEKKKSQIPLCYLSLGSNLGDRLRNLQRGIRLLQGKGLVIRSLSSIYETEPVGMAGVCDYYNLVMEVETSLQPEDLLSTCLQIESEMGRIRDKDRKKSRTFDADIIFYGDLVLKTERLTIPHPRMHQRKFVLVPLAEIAPYIIHPVFKKNVRLLIDECQDACMVRKLDIVI
ncbi:MAG: 2-amino-4-hydroxy-6-hydroxymethyldihydropteridine diphosphokinase [Acidobacteriota bacterium]